VEGTNKARETRAYEVSCVAIHAETLRAKLMDSQNDDDQEARKGLFIAHGNRNHNHRPSLTIIYDEELSTTTTAPSSRPPSTPLTKLNSKTTQVNVSVKKDTYASRTTATSSTKSNIKTTNKTSNAVSDKHRSDEATRSDALLERMAAHDTRMAKIESEHETRLTVIESKLIHQSATITRMGLSTSKEIKAPGALITTLTAEVTALVALVRPEQQARA
jgi:hypothetical protein